MMRVLPKCGGLCSLLAALVFFLVGCEKHISTPREMLADYAKAKEAEARHFSKIQSDRWPGEVHKFFRAAKAGDWDQATNLFGVIQQLYESKGTPRTNRGAGFMAKSYAFLARTGLTATNYWPDPFGAQWRPVDEVGFAIVQFRIWDPELLNLYASNLQASLPSKSVFVSGTDPGYYLAPVFGRPKPGELPFCLLTPNALVDTRYLNQARSQYAKQLNLPSPQNMQAAFSQYISEVSQRFASGQTKPGEMVATNAAGSINVSGQVAVMEINALLLQNILTNNPGREFYYDENWKLDWTLPFLTPHGLIMKLNHDPIATIDAAAVTRDQDYWNSLLHALIGREVNEATSLAELADFTERTYLRKDLSQFAGNPHFATNSVAQVTFAKARISIAGVYAWRAENSTNPNEKERMTRAADLAFRQALALHPQSKELEDYGHFLYSQNRSNDLQVLSHIVSKFAPAGTTAEHLSSLLKSRP